MPLFTWPVRVRCAIARATAAPVIEAKGLENHYRGPVRGSPRRALNGLDLRVEGPGVVNGFLGPNVSGKTTTLRVRRRGRAPSGNRRGVG